MYLQMLTFCQHWPGWEATARLLLTARKPATVSSVGVGTADNDGGGHCLLVIFGDGGIGCGGINTSWHGIGGCLTGYYFGLKGHFRCPRNGLPGPRRKSSRSAQILPRRFSWRLAEPQPPQPPSSKHQLMCNNTIPGDDCLPHSIANMESHANRSRSYMGILLWDVTARAILDRSCTTRALPDLLTDGRSTAVASQWHRSTPHRNTAVTLPSSTAQLPPSSSSNAIVMSPALANSTVRTTLP